MKSTRGISMFFPRPGTLSHEDLFKLKVMARFKLRDAANTSLTKLQLSSGSSKPSTAQSRATWR